MTRTSRRCHWGIAAVTVVSLVASITVTAADQNPAALSSPSESIPGPACSAGDVAAPPANAAGQYEPGSILLRAEVVSACKRAVARADQDWLAAGVIPGSSPELRSMARRALLDLHAAVQPGGAVMAGWRPGWEYSWPRDSSWVAVALAQTGHRADAFRILRFLQRTELPDGQWAARYWPDGAPVLDGRPVELDADGWVPWAIWSWSTTGPARSATTRRELTQLWPAVQAAATASVRAIGPDGLPAASMDYWEDGVQVTLDTAAPLLAGLRAAAGIATELGAGTAARRWDRAAATLANGIQGAFGRYGYHRLPGDSSGADAAVTFLGPPFEEPDPAVSRAVASSQETLSLPGGGLLPGSDWPGSTTIAWTAETGFCALFDAELGHQQAAGRILAWLAAHRTPSGSLPEQVNAQGKPVSVAPLSWTDAVVLLTLVAQAHPLPVVPGAKL